MSDEKKSLDGTRFPEIPAFEQGTADEPYLGNDTTVTYGFVGVDAEAAEAYRETLESSGFTRVAENKIADCTFATFTQGELSVRVAHYPAKALCKIIATRSEKFVTYENVKTGDEPHWTPSITQLGRKGALQWSPGMSYVIRNRDGSYVIFDGGPRDDDDVDHLMTFLRVHQPKAGKPVIAMWLFSHPHQDHLNNAMAFWDKYHDEIDLRAVAFNFPNMDATVLGRENPNTVKGHYADVVTRMEKYFPDARRYTPHTGDRYVMPGYVIDTLVTYEDLYPEKFSDINYFSLAWMIRSENKKVLILGDTGRRISQRMADAYRFELKCDIMQICHHGNFGATMDLYRYADPDICLWPEKERMLKDEPFILGTKVGFEFNDWLWHSRQRLHLHTSITTSFELD